MEIFKCSAAKTALTIALLLVQTFAFGQNAGRYDLFFVSIGSTHYLHDNYVDTTGELKSIFRNIQGANKSARLCSEFLESKSGKGILMTSTGENYISKKDFYSSVDSISRIIETKKSKKPFIVYYYCGHGVSEVVSGMRYLIPGSMQGDISKMHVDEKKQNAVCVNDLYDSLTQLKIPFMLILDCCADKEIEYYEGLSAVFTGTAINNLESTMDVMKAWFSIKGDYPVICSAKLGETTTTVKDPTDTGSSKNIGPVCRRILIAGNKSTTGTTPKMFVNSLRKLNDNETKIPDILCDEALQNYKHAIW